MLLQLLLLLLLLLLVMLLLRHAFGAKLPRVGTRLKGPGATKAQGLESSEAWQGARRAGNF